MPDLEIEEILTNLIGKHLVVNTDLVKRDKRLVEDLTMTDADARDLFDALESTFNNKKHLGFLDVTFQEFEACSTVGDLLSFVEKNLLK